MMQLCSEQAYKVNVDIIKLYNYSPKEMFNLTSHGRLDNWKDTFQNTCFVF